jgi:hypothetical protein
MTSPSCGTRTPPMVIGEYIGLPGCFFSNKETKRCYPHHISLLKRTNIRSSCSNVQTSARWIRIYRALNRVRRAWSIIDCRPQNLGRLILSCLDRVDTLKVTASFFFLRSKSLRVKDHTRGRNKFKLSVPLYLAISPRCLIMEKSNYNRWLHLPCIIYMRGNF